jgi:hypothetical protein
MPSREAPSAHSSYVERMGALAKWIAAKAEEMSQLDRKIDRRLEHLQRSEDNLRSMFEAIREQVASAHAVSDELQKRSIAGEERQQKARDTILSDVESTLEKALEKASGLLETVESKARELENTADTIVQRSMERLEELAEQTRLAQAAAVPQQSRFESETVSVHEEYDQRSAEVIESIRRSAVEQIERLASQAAVAVEPILSRVDAQRQRAEAQLQAAVDSAEDVLRRRAEELGRTGDIAVDNLEQRLVRRLENVRPRAMETLEAAERTMNQRLAAIVDSARLRICATEDELTDRVTQMRPRLNQSLQSVQDDLVEQLARLEEHAFSMTGWLEKRMTERVDALVARTRAALSQTPANPPAPLSPEAVSLVCYADEYAAPTAANSVSVQVFVDRRTDRISRSASASIFQ